MIVPPLFMIQTTPYVSLFKMLMYYSPLYLWLLIMFTRPHKEERFLYVVYPLFIEGAAIAIVKIKAFVERFGNDAKTSFFLTYINSYNSSLIFSIALFSALRIAAIFKYFRAPINAYTFLSNELKNGI